MKSNADSTAPVGFWSGYKWLISASAVFAVLVLVWQVQSGPTSVPEAESTPPATQQPESTPPASLKTAAEV